MQIVSVLIRFFSKVVDTDATPASESRDSLCTNVEEATRQKPAASPAENPIGSRPTSAAFFVEPLESLTLDVGIHAADEADIYLPRRICLTASSSAMSPAL